METDSPIVTREHSAGVDWRRRSLDRNVLDSWSHSKVLSSKRRKESGPDSRLARTHVYPGCFTSHRSVVRTCACAASLEACSHFDFEGRQGQFCIETHSIWTSRFTRHC